MLRMILIRHGRTSGNASGSLAGRTDHPVEPKALDGLVRLAADYPYPSVDALYCSPLRRCLQTAACLFPGMEAAVAEDLIEIDFGELEGKYVPDVVREMGAERFRNRDLALSFPGGESLGEVLVRADRAVDFIVAEARRQGSRSVAVVSHAIFLSTFLYHRAEPRMSFEELSCPNGLGVDIGVDPDPDGWAATRRVVYRGLLPAGAPRALLKDSPHRFKSQE